MGCFLGMRKCKIPSHNTGKIGQKSITTHWAIYFAVIICHFLNAFCSCYSHSKNTKFCPWRSNWQWNYMRWGTYIRYFQYPSRLIGVFYTTMITSSNGDIFRVTGHLCGEFTGPQWRGALMLSLIWAWINGWVNNRAAGDLRRHHAHYDVIVM